MFHPLRTALGATRSIQIASFSYVVNVCNNICMVSIESENLFQNRTVFFHYKEHSRTFSLLSHASVFFYTFLYYNFLIHTHVSCARYVRESQYHFKVHIIPQHVISFFSAQNPFSSWRGNSRLH